MSYLGIGSSIPEISNLPGQTGGEIEVTLDYPVSSACTSVSPFLPSEATPPGGTFAATPSGLNINSSTGEVTPSGSTQQAYTISYTVSGVISQFALTINEVQQSTFSYSASSFQQIGTATPTLAGGTTLGGTFTASTGVSINSSTGVIDLAASTIGGPYTITYTTPGPCASASTFDISVTAVAVELIENNFAMEFDAVSSEYIEAPNDSSLQLTDKLTLSCWIKASDVSATNSIIDKFYDGVDRSYMLRLQSTTIRLSLGNASGSASVAYQSTATLSNNIWYHIATTFSSADNEVKIYINGSLDSTHSKTDLISSNNQPLRLGAGYNLLNYFDGDMDEVAIWNKALELEDIQRIYNATNDNPGKCANLFTAGLGTDLVFWNRMGD